MTTAPTLTDGPVTLRLLDAGRAEVAVGSGGTGPLEASLGRLLDRAFGEQGVLTVHWHVPVGDWAARRVAHRLGFAHDGLLRRWQPGRDRELDDAWLCTLLAEDPREPRKPWLEVPVLEGDGVRLRPYTAADAPRIAEGLGDAEVQHWLAFMPRDPGAEDARRYLEKVQERLATAHTLTWAFCSSDGPDDDRLLGEVGLYRLQEEAELGYWTHPEGRGRGLTTRAARVAVDHAFGTLGLDRLAAYASASNTASRRVLEAVGFRLVGLQRRAVHTGDGKPDDLAAYDLLAEDRISA